MKIGIYGGTFNPPHLGHVTAARFAMEALELDQLFFVPTAVPPHKILPEDSASAADRLAMTEIAADHMLLPERVAVDALELERSGKSYTVDTLREFRARFPEEELWLLLGSDMFLSLEEWREPEEICRLAHLAAFVRDSSEDADALEKQADRFCQQYATQAVVVKLPRTIDISSTELRAALKEGGGSPYLLPAVYGYILRNGLYGTQADLAHLTLEQLRACSYSMMKAKRMAHVKGVEEEAVKLARFWGADEAAARRAGILHDCTKYFTLKEQLQICAKYDIVVDDLENTSEKLLHSKTGAALARYVYGQSEEVFWAIYWHTTGRANMDLLEKILYLADYMEPNRDFPGVEELRNLCYQDLDAALLMGLQMSIDDLHQRGVPVHKNSQAALDWLLDRRKG